MGDGPRDFGRVRAGAAALVAAKGDRTVTVCIPALNEAATIGAVVAAVVGPHTAPGGTGLVDEVLVVDDGSTDATAALAAAAGARVVHAPGPPGKGQAMAAGLAEAAGDLLVFLDADVENTEAVATTFVTSLLAPLLGDDDVALVKGYYERPLGDAPTGGGRVTELMARPLLEVLFPELAGVRQPLAGETAGPRSVFEKVGFAPAYGVEFGLLVDVARLLGPGAIGQVDLGVRVHRNRPLDALRPQAVDVLRAALERAGRTPPLP